MRDRPASANVGLGSRYLVLARASGGFQRPAPIVSLIPRDSYVLVPRRKQEEPWREGYGC